MQGCWERRFARREKIYSALFSVGHLENSKANQRETYMSKRSRALGCLNTFAYEFPLLFNYLKHRYQSKKTYAVFIYLIISKVHANPKFFFFLSFFMLTYQKFEEKKMSP